MVVLTFCIDEQMPEKKYFQQKFLLCKCHLTAGIPVCFISSYNGLHWTEKWKLFITSYKEISDSIIEKDR